jgi:hypothetical protein
VGKKVFGEGVGLEVLMAEEVSDFGGWVFAKNAPPF